MLKGPWGDPWGFLGGLWRVLVDLGGILEGSWGALLDFGGVLGGLGSLKGILKVSWGGLWAPWGGSRGI